MSDSLKRSTGAAGARQPHDSAVKHVTGRAGYVDDLPALDGQLHAYVGQSSIAHGTIVSMDLETVRGAPGVVDLFTAADVPGKLDIGPLYPGDPLLVEERVSCYGQPLFAVVATSYKDARAAAQLAEIEYRIEAPQLDGSSALAQQQFVRPPHHMKRGDAESAIVGATGQLQGELSIGGQEHLYLEGQAAVALPDEDGGVMVHTSSQHPSEVQHLVAQVLSMPLNAVTVSVRRMGGAFGGKETNGAAWACLAAVAAKRTGRPVKLRLARRDDMVMTGKRHPFLTRYAVGFDDSGLIKGIRHQLLGICGHSPDLSDAIVDRAMFHCDNAYYLPNVEVAGYRCMTHTVSNTAFRGFGGPQGMLAMEAAMDDIARAVGCDPLDVRKRNFYGGEGCNVTPYHQQIDNNPLPGLVDELEQSADYRARRQAVSQFNLDNPILKKGLALTPVKFGISFTVKHLNQAGALLHLYTDGTLHLNHGGTEMGQGLYTKVAQIVAEVFQVDVATIAVSAARTDKVPNTSPTAASSGCDLNGMAAHNAAQTIKERLNGFACDHYSVAPEDVRFINNRVEIGGSSITFAELAKQAYLGRIQLSASGYYRTPKIHYDREKGSGHPFYYFANGAACSEVVVDTLTGEARCLRVDILHDVGRSLNPAIDIGQIEGGFIQGLGWLTSEELRWDDKGRLLSDTPATYKIPAIGDTPPVFNVKLLENAANAEETIFRSKAVGEPPLMLAISAWCAIRDAVASLGDYRASPRLQAPATPEHILDAIDEIRSRP